MEFGKFTILSVETNVVSAGSPMKMPPVATFGIEFAMIRPPVSKQRAEVGSNDALLRI